MADQKTRFDIIIQKLRDNGHKITPQRLAIVKIIAQSEGHPSVEDIYDQLRNDFPTMSLATVYRNIVTIKSLGEVLELGFQDGSICIKCKKIVDPDLDSLDEMEKEIASETKFKILNHRLDFFGICSECMANQQ